MNLRNLLTLLLVFYLIPAQTLAAETQALEDIINAAKTFMLNEYDDTNQDINIMVGSLDRRLRLKRCELPLEAYRPGYPPRGGKCMVGVRCNGSTPWSIYVPITIQHYKSVAVLSQSIGRNQVLSHDNITFKKVDVNRLNAGYFESIQQLEGKISSRTLPAETILTHQLIRVEQAIRPGQNVTLVARNSVIEVRAEGQAMSRGAIGDRIKVKNLKTNRIIEGTILNKDLINVNL